MNKADLLFVCFLRRAARGGRQKKMNRRCCCMLATPIKNETKDLIDYYD